MKIRVKKSVSQWSKNNPSKTVACVLIPSAGRADVLFEMFTRQPWLNLKSTFVGIQNDQWKAYRKVREKFSDVTYIRFDNPDGATVVAREHLRRAAVEVGFKRYVCTDDNAHFEQQSLINLVRASLVYKPQPVVVAGMPGSTKMDAKPTIYDAPYVKRSGHTVGGLRFYKKIGMMFWVFPHELYSKVKYPMDKGCMEDHSITLQLMSRFGFTNFVTCMDAPFKKKRFQPGGQGGAIERATKIGYAWLRFAKMYPDYMAHVRMLWPYAKFFKMTKKRTRDEDIPF